MDDAMSMIEKKMLCVMSRPGMMPSMGMSKLSDREMEDRWVARWGPLALDILQVAAQAEDLRRDFALWKEDMVALIDEVMV